MTISHLPDWRSRLTAHLNSLSRSPFAYGENDCGLFAAGCVEVKTGTDLAARYRGLYQSLKDGLKLLRKEGFDSHVAVVAAHFKAVPSRFCPSRRYHGAARTGRPCGTWH